MYFTVNSVWHVISINKHLILFLFSYYNLFGEILIVKYQKSWERSPKLASPVPQIPVLISPPMGNRDGWDRKLVQVYSSKGAAWWPQRKAMGTFDIGPKLELIVWSPETSWCSEMCIRHCALIGWSGLLWLCSDFITGTCRRLIRQLRDKSLKE